MLLALIRGWLPAIAIAIGIVFVTASLQRNATVVRVEPIAYVAVLALVCFGRLARTDRRAFASLFVPAAMIAFTSLLLPAPFAFYVGMVPTVGLILFLAVAPVRRWWWRTILRRRPATPRQRFAYAVQLEDVAWTTGVNRDGPDVPPPDAGLLAAEAAVERMAALAAPDAESSAIRDVSVAIARRWIDYARRHDPQEDSAPLVAELQRSQQLTAALRNDR
jgi:hypothetical protein